MFNYAYMVTYNQMSTVPTKENTVAPIVAETEASTSEARELVAY